MVLQKWEGSSTDTWDVSLSPVTKFLCDFFLATCACGVLQNGDIIAPELTPLKSDWNSNNNNEGEGGGGGSGSAAAYNSARGASRPKKKLF